MQLRTRSRWAYAEQGWARIAALAPIVIECAAQGDAVADTILKHGVGELFRSVKAVTTKLDLERSGQPFRLVLAGTFKSMLAVLVIYDLLHFKHWS